MVSLMTALWFSELRAEDRVSVKPHASPVLHAINYLLGRLERAYLESLRAFGGLQSYPSRTKDPDPVDYSTGSVGIGATAPIWGAMARRYLEHHRFEAPPRGPPDRAAGRRRARRGRRLGGDRRPVGGPPRRGALGRGPEPPVARPRRARHRLRPARRDVRGRRLAGAHRQVRAQARVAVRARRAARTCGGASTRCRTRSTSASCAPTPPSCASGSRGGTRASRRWPASSPTTSCAPRFRDLGGHDIGKLIEAYRAVQHDRPTVIFAYTIKGWSLPIEGHPENHSALLTDEQFAELAKQLGTDADDPWAPFDAGSPEGELAAAAAASARARGAGAARAARGAGVARPEAPREGVDPAGLRPLLRRPRARRARRWPSGSSP